MRKGRKPEIAAGREPEERREPVVAELEVDAEPRRLRQSLATVDDLLREADPEIARRVLLLLGEIVARSTDPDRHPSGSIRIKLTILPSRVRIDIAGMALLTPQDQGEPEGAGAENFPGWVLGELADQWGLDQRASEPAMWLLVARAAEDTREA